MHETNVIFAGKIGVRVIFSSLGVCENTKMSNFHCQIFTLINHVFL